MNFEKILSLSYLLESTPGQSFRYFWVCFVFFLLLIFAGQYMRTMIKKSPDKKILKRLFPNVASRLAWTAFFGYLFLFFRYENMPYLAARIWLLAFILFGLYQLGKTAYIYTKTLPIEIGKKQEKHDSKKYMPKKKK